MPSPDLQVALARALLISPLQAAFGGSNSFQAASLMLGACPVESSERGMLHHLGACLQDQEPAWAKVWFQDWRAQQHQQGQQQQEMQEQREQQADATDKSQQAPQPVQHLAQQAQQQTGEAADSVKGTRQLKSCADADADADGHVVEVQISAQQQYIEHNIRRLIYGKGVEMSEEARLVDEVWMWYTILLQPVGIPMIATPAMIACVSLS